MRHLCHAEQLFSLPKKQPWRDTEIFPEPQRRTRIRQFIDTRSGWRFTGNWGALVRQEWFFLGNGLLEVSGRSADPPGTAMAIWI